MKKSILRRSLKHYKVILLLFIVLLLISFVTLPPAKVKRLALTQNWSIEIDTPLDLALTEVPASGIGVPLPTSQAAEAKSNFIISQVIGSGTIYRGPPSFSL